MHILYAVKLGWVHLEVHAEVLAGLLVYFGSIPALLDVERALPVSAVQRDKEVLEVIQSVHILWHIFLAQLFANVTL